MRNGLGEVQHILLLGGSSDIGAAIVRELQSAHTTAVTLACRATKAGEDVAATIRTGATAVDVVAFDATNPDDHERVVADARALRGDIDVAIIAFAQIGDGVLTDVQAAIDLAAVNFAGAVASAVAVANAMRHQGHGHLVVLSSVAGVRVRKANALYGATKAGLDGFAQGLADDLHGTGVTVTVVRPGFVHSAMTAGLPAAPFATTPEAVAKATVRGIRAKARVVWVPGTLRVVFAALRLVPAALWRRLPG